MQTNKAKQVTIRVPSCPALSGFVEGKSVPAGAKREKDRDVPNVAPSDPAEGVWLKGDL